MEVEVWKALASHGILGIITALFAWAYWKERAERNALQQYLTDTLRAQQREFLQKQEELMAQHAAQVQAMQDRMITRSQTEQEKLAGLVSAQQKLLDAVSRR